MSQKGFKHKKVAFRRSKTQRMYVYPQGLFDWQKQNLLKMKKHSIILKTLWQKLANHRKSPIHFANDSNSNGASPKLAAWTNESKREY